MVDMEHHSKIRVLVVEDDEDDYILTTSLLSEIYYTGVAPQWVRTYEEAIERIGSDDYDVCLLDYRLGPHDGLDVLREARERGVDAPLILLTGQGDIEVDLQAMKAGASDYLVKGQTTAADLERSIRYAIQQRQIARERIRHVLEREARTQAEAANKAKDDFLAMVSHELRAPLNAMLGWVTILRNSPDDRVIRERAIDAIERSARSQNKLVNDLLDISRVTSGNLWIEKQPVPLASVMESAIDEAFPAMKAKSIKLTLDIDHNAGVVEGDMHRLLQVLNNLLQNAVKFTPEGGRLTVSLERHGPTAKISVADNGVGIEPEFLPHVFDRYRQSRGMSERREGLGLGLAIARHIVEMHGGTIAVDSAGKGRGAVFTVTLPLLIEAAAAQ